MPLDFLSLIQATALLNKVELNPPHKPRSEELIISNATLGFARPTKTSGKSELSFDPPEREDNMRLKLSAYTLEDSANSWALRNLLAATIFIAEVIFLVDLTLDILVFRSLRLGISYSFDKSLLKTPLFFYLTHR